MAETKAFGKAFASEFTKELTCSFCNDIYTRPKTLKCHHSFCSKCLVNWSEECTKQRSTLTCPVCAIPIESYRQDMSDIPPLFGFEPLLKLFQALKLKPVKQDQRLAPKCAGCSKRLALVAFCVQCKGMICKECVVAHKTLKTVLEDHHPTLLADFNQGHLNTYMSNQVHCKEQQHEKDKLEFYCQVCNKSVCQKCVETDHNSHEKTSIEEAALTIKKNIKRGMNRTKPLIENYIQDKTTFNDNVTKLEEEILAAKKKVHDVIHAQVKALQDHEMTMMIILDDMLQKEIASNEYEQSEININIQQIAEYRHQCQEIEGSAVSLKVLDSYPYLRDTCKMLSEKAILSNKAVKKNVSLHYVPNLQTMECLKNPGYIQECVTDQSRCTIESLHEVRCGYLNSFDVVTRNSDLKVCDTAEGLLEVQVIDADDQEVEKEVKLTRKGTFTVTYRALKPSPYKIVVSIGGKEISNSPQTAATVDAQAKFKAVRTFGKDVPMKLHNPCSIALSKDGEVAVADTGNDRIVMFSPEWKFLREFAGEGDDDGLSRPWGVVFHEDRVIVSDNPDDDGRIQEFDIKGTYLKTIYRRKGAEMLGMCTTELHIACLEDGETKRQIKLFDKRTGHPVQDIEVDGIKGNPPTFLAYNDGKYFVPFVDDSLIRVFDSNGNVLYNFGENGKHNGQISCAAGLVSCSKDMIFVCDADNDRIQAFSQEGRFITSFGSRGSDLGKMLGPIHAVVTPYGRVLVLECNGSRIQVWR